MARKLIQVIGSNLDDDPVIAPIIASRDNGQFAIFLCDTEADLPTPEYGYFAVCKNPGKFYWSTDTVWKTVKSQHIEEI